MKICLALVPVFLIATSCNQNRGSESLINDSTKQDAINSSQKTKVESSPEMGFGYNIDVDQNEVKLDTADFHLILGTCAILIEETAQQTRERAAREEEEYKAGEEQARLTWETEHPDSVEFFPGYTPGYEGDGDYYYSNAIDILSKLKVQLITAQPKNFVKLRNTNGDTYTINIRERNIVPEWTIILFRADKNPILVEAMDVAEEPVRTYYFQN